MEWLGVVLGFAADLCGRVVGFVVARVYKRRKGKMSRRAMEAEIETLRAENESLRSRQHVTINLAPGATYNEIKNDGGEVHLHFDGKGEIVSFVPVQLGTHAIGAPTISVSATKVKATPPAASDDERPQ